MPESKSRHPHKHPQQHHHNITEKHPAQKKANRIIIALVLFFSILGLGIGLFIDSSSIFTVLAATIAGGLAGFILGYKINNNLSGK